MTRSGGTPETRWIGVVAIFTFAAGLVAGLAIPMVVKACTAPAEEAAGDPDEIYVQELAREYELSADQVRVLRMILMDVRNESTRILRQIIQGDPGKLPPQLLTVRNRADERIQVLLTNAQRDRFNRDKR